MSKLSDTKCKNKYGKVKKKKDETYIRQFRKTILKQQCAPGITTFHSTLHLTTGITHGFYLESMKYIDVNYPGLKEMFAHTWLSVQGQEK